MELGLGSQNASSGQDERIFRTAKQFGRLIDQIGIRAKGFKVFDWAFQIYVRLHAHNVYRYFQADRTSTSCRELLESLTYFFGDFSRMVDPFGPLGHTTDHGKLIRKLMQKSDPTADI